MNADLIDFELLLAEKAERVKKNLLDVYFNDSREKYFSDFINTPVDDTEGLIILKYKVDALADLETDINNMIEGGKVASATKQQLGE